ncbi:hypothetical protein [Clostridium tertium]|jgi:hypothetical protein|uniref:hypothetical protein n=1 Tax=Clostridium tertium TaxID=1559 RepID=UPI000C088FA9|nr:hypothetical protein [Clostridium tertium]
MATVTKNNKHKELEPGFYEVKFINFKSAGKKVTQRGDVFNCGYIFFELLDGTIVKEYTLLTPWKNFMFYKLIKATKKKFKIENECKNFLYMDILNDEVVIEVEYDFNGVSTYLNIVNIYGIEEGRKIIAHINQLESKELDEESEEENSIGLNNEVALNKFDIDFGNIENDEINF